MATVKLQFPAEVTSISIGGQTTNADENGRGDFEASVVGALVNLGFTNAPADPSDPAASDAPVTRGRKGKDPAPVEVTPSDPAASDAPVTEGQ